MDKSNGYEGIAPNFIKHRGQSINGIGVSSVRKWVLTLPVNCTVLDIGCGTGIPISKIIIDEGMTVYGIDASPALMEVFRQNFPSAPFACEAVEDSQFFNRKFEAIIAWGLIFLLPVAAQTMLISKIPKVLNLRGKLLLTAPRVQTEWWDVMTGLRSVSLGAEKYRELLSISGLSLLEEFSDEGENYYFSAAKVDS